MTRTSQVPTRPLYKVHWYPPMVMEAMGWFHTVEAGSAPLEKNGASSAQAIGTRGGIHTHPNEPVHTMTSTV